MWVMANGNFMDTIKPIRLAELKLQATFLFKRFKSNSENSHLLAERLLQLPHFKSYKTDTLATNKQWVKLKHVYHLLALENGCKSWGDLKDFVIENDMLYNQSGVPYIHSWFQRYKEALIYFKVNGGYLLSFWNDFIVCGDEYIKCLELHSYPLE